MHNIFISCKESRIENNRSFYGCFNIGPFDSAQSLTIGNALRRTLLSECSGLGMTSVMIDNVSHEYSTLKGMRESVLDLLLNLKEIVFTIKCTNNGLGHIYPAQLYEQGDGGQSASVQNAPHASSEGYQQSEETALNEAIATRQIRRKKLLINNVSSLFIEKGFAGRRAKRSPSGETSSFYDFNTGKSLKDENSLLKSKDILNLLVSKQKHLKKPLIGYLKVKGPGIIRAKNLKLPPFVQCVDENQYIATLAEDGFLSMKFILMEGKGYIIQKNQPFFDNLNGTASLKLQDSLPNQFIKKRVDFVNQIEKNLNTNKPYATQYSIYSQSLPRRMRESEINRVASYGESSEQVKLRKTRAATCKTGSSFALQHVSNFVNCKPLNLDCVFNPVTKVSYLIEDFDNKLINDFNSNFNFANDVSLLIESSYYLKNLNSFYKQNATNLNKTQNTQGARNALRTECAANSIFSQKIINFVDNYSKDEMQQLLTYLSNPPLQKSKSLHNVVLEVWTNGGIHPREALTVAFQNLSSLFLNFKKL